MAAVCSVCSSGLSSLFAELNSVYLEGCRKAEQFEEEWGMEWRHEVNGGRGGGVAYPGHGTNTAVDFRCNGSLRHECMDQQVAPGDSWLGNPWRVSRAWLDFLFLNFFVFLGDLSLKRLSVGCVQHHHHHIKFKIVSNNCQHCCSTLRERLKAFNKGC